MAKTPRVDGALPLQNSIAPERLPTSLDTFFADCRDPDRIQHYIAAQLGRTVEACLEVGRGLAALKALCPHGEFMKRLGELGINGSLARRFMAAAVRFSNATTSPLLPAVGKQSKLLELLPLDDEQLEELAVTGKTGPLVLSEIMPMTVKAVRETVKQCREERRKVVGAILDEKNAILDAQRAERSTTPDALQPGDRIESLHARRPGTVVKVYADGSACVCWDDGEPQEAGLGHERVPRNLLVKVAAGGSPTKGVDVDAFETPADTAAGDVNDGPAAGHHVAALADGANLEVVGEARRVDAALHVHWAGRVFDVAGAGVCVGDTVICTPVESGPFVQVHRPGDDGPAYMAPMVRPVDAAPAGVPFARVVCQGLVVHYRDMVFDVSGAGVELCETVVCVADDDGLSLWVRRPGSDAPATRAPFVRKVVVQFVKPDEATAEPDDTTKPQHGVGGPAGAGGPPAQAPDPSVLRRKQYLADRMKVVLRYADGPELNGIEDMLEELVSDISRGRYVPGLVAADYDLTRKYWIEGSAK